MKVKRLSFATFLNDRLRKIIKELQDWHSVFDPSWWIIIRISNPQVDHQLIQQPQSSGVAEPLSQLKRLRNAISSESEETDFRQSMFISSTVLCGEQKPLPYSSLLSAQGSEVNSGKLIDQMRPGKRGAPLTSIKDVRDLARVLSGVEPFTFARMSLPKHYQSLLTAMNLLLPGYRQIKLALCPMSFLSRPWRACLESTSDKYHCTLVITAERTETPSASNTTNPESKR